MSSPEGGGPSSSIEATGWLVRRDVRSGRVGAVGMLRLDRPRAINALTRGMIAELHDRVTGWVAGGEVGALLLDGSGERGFCAGGDVRAVREAALAGMDPAAFFREEYALDLLLADLPIPLVAVMDGVTMGGGVGLGMNAAVRVVTERTRLALPETTIGLFPDVGATYLLARAPGELGTHLALTGDTVDGAGAIHLGLADVMLPSTGLAALPGVATRLAAGERLDLAELGEVTPPTELADDRAWVGECYVGDDPAVIVQRLEAHPDPRARAAGATIRTRSPLSVAVTLAALRRAASAASLAEVLTTDAIIAERLVGGGDFAEGVRAQLVDKDRSPRWRHARIEDVAPEEALAYLP